MRLGLCTVVTSRVEAMRAFYSGLLERSPEAHRDNFFLFSASGADIALWRRSEFEAYYGGMLGEEGGGAVLIELEVEDVAAEYERLRSLGFTPEEAPRTLPWGHTQFTVRDPDGNLVVLFNSEG
jgi:catechol 2,3-dioxygenase-like lactoylglutathione lyase family enzyme